MEIGEQEIVVVLLELLRDLVNWIYGLKDQLGFRNRGVIVAQLSSGLLP